MVSSTRKLLQDAENKTVKKQKTGPEKNNSYLLPYDLVYEFIANHPIIKNNDVHPQDAYNAINLYLDKDETKIIEEQPVVKNKPNCPECDIGFIILDAKEGQTLCNNCGVVTRNCLNIEPEFIKPPQIDSRKCGGKIPGVTKTVQNMLYNYSDIDKHDKIMEELEYHNIWTNVPVDDLVYLSKKIKINSKNTSVSFTAKIIGALLSYILKDKLISTEEFRNQLINGTSVKSIPTSPERKHACPNCKSTFHTFRDAKYHCSLLAKYHSKFK
jgi:protein-arginine kinase activator protein McsA